MLSPAVDNVDISSIHPTVLGVTWQQKPILYPYVASSLLLLKQGTSCVKSAVNGVESLCEIWRNADVSRIIPWGKHVCRGRIGDWCHGVGPDYGTFHGNQHISWYSLSSANRDP